MQAGILSGSAVIFTHSTGLLSRLARFLAMLATRRDMHDQIRITASARNDTKYAKIVIPRAN
jgi:hypothetical protein